MPSVDPYDRVPYGSRPLPEAHPDRLWVAGRLLGLAPPDPRTARILDLGCGAGLHLAATAARLPGATAVGVDRAGAAVAEARQTAARIGATNVTFLQGDLQDPGVLDAPGLPEAYDYVVAHGVYSWVDEPARDALLASCARRLAPDGIAYVSYNVRPGWHVRGMLAEMLQFHAAGFEAPEKQVAQARALLRFLAEAVPETDPYGGWLRREARLVDAQPDAWVYHDLLAEPNEAVLLHRFVAHAHRHGLVYLGDADVASMLPERLPGPVRQALDTLGADALRAEQYLDFVLCRSFRRSLVCRPGAPIDRSLSWDRLLDLTVHAAVQHERSDAAGETFRTRSGDALTTSVPLLVAALRILGARAPGGVPFRELVTRASAAAGTGDEAADGALIGRNLLACFARGLVSFGARDLPVASAPSERPRADPVVRALAGDGVGVPSGIHEWVPLEGLDRHLLPLLDGTRTVDELVSALVEDVTDAAPEERERIRALLGISVPERLHAYAWAALLTG